MDPTPSPKTPQTKLTGRWMAAIIAAGVIVTWVVVAMRPSVAPGKANLGFVLQDPQGESVNLESFKGRPLLVNFWATWCEPCKMEIPWFVEFADKYKARHLAIVGVSVDDQPADIETFAAKYKVNYPLLVGRGRNDVLAAFQAGDVVPVSWLIRADGTVAKKIQGIHPGDDPKAWFETQLQALF